MIKNNLFCLILLGVFAGILVSVKPVDAITVKPGTFSKTNHRKVEKINYEVKSEIFKGWKGDILSTETGKYPLSASVKLYDFAHTKDGKREYKHQPIVDFVYINGKLKQVIIRPCK